MTAEAYRKQIEAINSVTEEALKSKASAHQFLVDAGIIEEEPFVEPPPISAMAMSPTDKELLKCLIQLNDFQKKSLLELIKSFSKNDGLAEEQTIDQYNQELDQAMERINRSEFTMANGFGATGRIRSERRIMVAKRIGHSARAVLSHFARTEKPEYPPLSEIAMVMISNFSEYIQHKPQPLCAQRFRCCSGY